MEEGADEQAQLGRADSFAKRVQGNEASCPESFVAPVPSHTRCACPAASLLPALLLPAACPAACPPPHPPPRCTHHTPGMVSEVSATFVATTIRRWPDGGGLNTRACCAGGSMAYSGSTCTGPGSPSPLAPPLVPFCCSSWLPLPFKSAGREGVGGKAGLLAPVSLAQRGACQCMQNPSNRRHVPACAGS